MLNKHIYRDHPLCSIICFILVRCTTTRYQKVYNCVFPFIYKGKTYENCTADHSDNGKAWCAFYIKPGSVVPHYRQGDCNSDCPGEGILNKHSFSPSNIPSNMIIDKG